MGQGNSIASPPIGKEEREEEEEEEFKIGPWQPRIRGSRMDYVWEFPAKMQIYRLNYYKWLSAELATACV